MNKLEKLAYGEFNANVSNFNHEKEQAFLNLMQQKKFADLHKKENGLIIELSKKDNPKLSNDLKQVQLEKQNYINANNAKLLTVEYLCDKCQDKGYLGKKPCSCFKKVLSQVALKQSGLSINLDEYQNLNFSIFQNQNEIKKIYSKIDLWIEKFETSDIRNWAFMGNTGTGKTYLMFYMAKKLMDKGAYVYFTTASQLAKELLQDYTQDENEKEEYTTKYTNCDVLFVDDLGTELNKKKITNQLLYTIFNQRMLDNKPVVFSSNFDMEELENFYGERIFSRLINKRTTKSIWFDGEDLRLKKTKD